MNNTLTHSFNEMAPFIETYFVFLWAVSFEFVGNESDEEATKRPKINNSQFLGYKKNKL